MMGRDCERILLGINNIKNTLDSLIEEITGNVCNPIKVQANHGHPNDGDYITIDFTEKSSNNLSSILGSIKSSMSELVPDISQMKSLGSDMYTNTNSFNNSCGSPWTEINNLEKSINKLENFDMNYTKFIGGKLILIELLNSAIVSAVDAKWAIITYHDYIQRGYDSKVNNKIPSITFIGADKKRNIGNIKQNFDENVNMPEETIEVF